MPLISISPTTSHSRHCAFTDSTTFGLTHIYVYLPYLLSICRYTSHLSVSKAIAILPRQCQSNPFASKLRFFLNFVAFTDNLLSLNFSIAHSSGALSIMNVILNLFDFQSFEISFNSPLNSIH